MKNELNNKYYKLERSYTNNSEDEAEERKKLLENNGYTVFGIRKSDDRKERYTVSYGKELEK